MVPLTRAREGACAITNLHPPLLDLEVWDEEKQTKT